MNRAGVLALSLTVMATSVTAQTPIYLGDIQVLKQPVPAVYQPEDTTYDLADAGKSFDIACVITAAGTLSDCRALDNDIYDQNFIRLALDNTAQWVVATKTVDGRTAIGRTLSITVQFQPTELPENAVALADAR